MQVRAITRGMGWRFLTPVLGSILVAQFIAGQERVGSLGGNGPQHIIRRQRRSSGDSKNLFTAAACPYSTEWADFNLTGKDMLLGPAYQRDSEVWVHAVLDQSFTASCPFRCNFYDGEQTPGKLLSSQRAYCKPRYRTWKPADQRPYVISCKRNDQAQFVVVAQLKGENLQLGRPIRILRAEAGAASKRLADLAVCVPAVFSFKRTHQLDTFLAWYRHAGATRVFLYNHSWVNEIDLLIQAYNEKYPGYIAVTQWKFPAGLDHPKGKDGECWPNLGDLPTTQYLATNHCLMQAYLGGYTFTASIDLDEMLWNYHGADLQAGWLLKHMGDWQQANPSKCSLEVCKPCSRTLNPHTPPRTGSYPFPALISLTLTGGAHPTTFDSSLQLLRSLSRLTAWLWQVPNNYADTCEQYRKSGHLRHESKPRGPRKHIWVTRKVQAPDTHNAGGCARSQKRDVSVRPVPGNLTQEQLALAAGPERLIMMHMRYPSRGRKGLESPALLALMRRFCHVNTSQTQTQQ